MSDGGRSGRRGRAPTRRALLLGGGAALLAGCAVDGGAVAPLAGATSPENPNGSPASASQRTSTVKVALILPLTGAAQASAIAKGMKQAGELALFDRDDGTFQLMVLDDKGTPDGARQAAEQAVKDGAELILGPLFAGNVAGAAGPARAARIPLIAFSNDRQVAGNGVFIVGHTVETETDRVVGYAASRGLRRFAALVPDDAYGHLAEAAMKGAAQRAGGSVVAVQRLPRQANGMLEPARQLGLALREVEAAGQPADALFLPGDPELLAQISPLMAYAGIEAAKLKILGTGAMDQPGLGRDKTYLGAWFAAPDPSGWRQFNSQFVKTYGSAPPRIATLAYDAVGMAISLSKAPAGTRYSPDTLTRSSGFAGVDGLLQLSSSGLPTRALAVLEVQDLGAIVVDPSSAQPPTQVSAAGGRLN